MPERACGVNSGITLPEYLASASDRSCGEAQPQRLTPRATHDIPSVLSLPNLLRLAFSTVALRCISLRRHSRRAFPAEDKALAFGTPTILTHNARLANDAMAWDQKSNGIAAHGGAYRACGGRHTNSRSEIAIADQCPGWNLQQRAPDAQLKRRRTDECTQWSAALRTSWPDRAACP